jgi:hypothetical protein
MAENGEIPKGLAALRGRCPICVACLFGQAHKAHGKPNPSRSIQFASQLMMRQGRKHRLIRWFLLNLD